MNSKYLFMSFKSNDQTLPLNDFYTLYNDYVNQSNIYTIFKFFFSHFDDYFSFIFKNKIYSMVLIKLLCKSKTKLTDMIRDYAINDKDIVRKNFINQHMRIIDFIMKYNYLKFQEIGKIQEIRIDDYFRYDDATFRERYREMGRNVHHYIQMRYKNNDYYIRMETVIADCLYYQNKKNIINNDFFKIFEEHLKINFKTNVNYTCDNDFFKNFEEHLTLNDKITFKTNVNCTCDNHLIKKYISMNDKITMIPNNYLMTVNFDVIQEVHLQLFSNQYENYPYKDVYKLYEEFLNALEGVIPNEIINELRNKLKQYKEGPCLNYFIYEISETLLHKYIYLLLDTPELCVHNRHLKKALIKSKYTDYIRIVWLYEYIIRFHHGMYLIINNEPLKMGMFNVQDRDTFFYCRQKSEKNERIKKYLIDDFNKNIYPKL